MISESSEVALRLAVAALGGLAVGRGLFRAVAGLGLAALTIASLISLAIF